MHVATLADEEDLMHIHTPTNVEEWMASSSPYDLVFTTGFDNDQRKDMHQVARRFNLKSKSYGKGEGRHLTISK